MKRARDFPTVHVCVSVTKERFSADIFPSIHRSARLDQKYICSNEFVKQSSNVVSQHTQNPFASNHPCDLNRRSIFKSHFLSDEAR